MTKLFVSILVSLIITTIVSHSPVFAQQSLPPRGHNVLSIPEPIILTCVQDDPADTPRLANFSSSADLGKINDCDTTRDPPKPTCVECLLAMGVADVALVHLVTASSVNSANETGLILTIILTTRGAPPQRD